MARSIKNDYLEKDATLGDFYPWLQGPDWEKAMETRADFSGREALCEVLMEAYQGKQPSEKTQSALAALAHPDTFTVTTGHQLGFLGGPLYTVYKVISTIRLAEELEAKYPGKRIVPIFWIHTEDHDYEEINHAYQTYSEKLSYAGTFQSAVGKHVLDDSILSLVPAHWKAALRNAWQPGKTWAAAFFDFAFSLFDAYGVLILNPDDVRLKAQFIPVLEQEFVVQRGHDLIAKQSERMEAAGYKPQITPRMINLFHLDEQARTRIVELPSEDGSATSDRLFTTTDNQHRWTENELRQLLHAHPERFSPNVALRPLYQEYILPNLAYIGGWGELSYWMQLSDMFALFNTPFPVLLPRMSATFVPQADALAWQELGYALADLERPLHELWTQEADKYWDEAEFQAKTAELDAPFQALENYIEQVEPTLARSLQGHKAKHDKFIETLAKKLRKAIRNKHPKPFLNIETLKQKLQPDTTRQERVWSLAALTGISPDDFIRLVYEQCKPLDFTNVFLVSE